VRSKYSHFAFFPRTSAWQNLKKALRGTYDEAVRDHLAGTTSAPFEAGEYGQDWKDWKDWKE
jgi:adenine-specific DNA-methyltransferase